MLRASAADVVFFGDGVPKDRAEQYAAGPCIADKPCLPSELVLTTSRTLCRALQLASQCSALLVVGSSCQVYSAYRLVRAAHAAGAQVAILNGSATRADQLAVKLVPALAGEALARLAAHPSLLVPRL